MINRMQTPLILTARKFTRVTPQTLTSRDKMKIPIIGKPVEYTLKMSGLWPDYFNVLGVVVIGSALFTIIPFQVWDIYREFDNPLVMLDILSLFLAEILLYAKFLVIWYHRRVFESLLREMADDYETETNIELWSKLILTSHRFSKFDYAIYVGTSAMYYLQFILNYSAIPVEDREMMMRAHYPFDYKNSPMFEIVTVIQVVLGLAMVTLQALSESLLVALILHLCGHIDLLLERVEEFSVSCINNPTNTSLVLVIKQHLKVLNLFHKVDEVYTYASFVQVFLSTFIICSIGFIILTITDDIVIVLRFVMFGITVTWQGYSFCFFGQRLINQSEKISNKLYEAFWYNADPKHVRALSYIISKAQTPLILSAGKFTSLSAQTFTSIMKTSFSYISVLRAGTI